MHPIISITIALLFSTSAGATDVTLAGLFTDKALVQIDGGALRTLSVGQKTAEDVVLVSVESDAAIFDIQGQRVKVEMGHARTLSNVPSAAFAQLTADTHGHFVADGQVNGVPTRFIVDTGATLIVLPASEAQRLALDYRKGPKGTMSTANGKTVVYRIKLDTVRIGGLTLHGIDAAVTEGQGPPQSLLGMSFLNRTDMKREGDIMTLTKRY